MSKFKKDLPIYALSASLVFLGIASASEAQAAWTAAEKKTVTQMQKQIGILSEQINSLEDQLGETKQFLEEISSLIGNNIYTNELIHKCNWKFICENVVDNIHCFSLHENTLMKLGYCNLNELKMEKFNNNSIVTTPNKFKEEYKKRDSFLNKFIPRKLKTDVYQHAFIYPNLTVAIFEGLNITIGNILP